MVSVRNAVLCTLLAVFLVLDWPRNAVMDLPNFIWTQPPVPWLSPMVTLMPLSPWQRIPPIESKIKSHEENLSSGSVSMSYGLPEFVSRQADDFLSGEVPTSQVLIDFLADTGDGTSSTFAVLGTVGQPQVNLNNLNDAITLPRANHLIIGGDLVYPEPTWEVWKKRFITPFFAAGVCSFESGPRSRGEKESSSTKHNETIEFLKNPSHRMPMVEWAAQGRLWTTLLHYVTQASRSGSSAPDTSLGRDTPTKNIKNFNKSSLDQGQQTKRPRLWATFGNHDSLDGGNVFQRGILLRDNITSFSPWLLPQTQPFFHFIETHWLFLSVNDQHGAGTSDRDIDSLQFLTIMDLLASNASFHSVVLIIHQPFWLDSKPYPGPLLQKVMNTLFGRLRAIIAGDMHYFAHWAPKEDPRAGLNDEFNTNFMVKSGIFLSKYLEELPHRLPHLIVSGGGGAFLHPTTHVPEEVRLHLGTISPLHPNSQRPKKGTKNPAIDELGVWAYELDQTFPSKKADMGPLVNNLLFYRVLFLFGCVFFASVIYCTIPSDNHLFFRTLVKYCSVSFAELLWLLLVVAAFFALFVFLPSSLTFDRDTSVFSPVFVSLLLSLLFNLPNSRYFDTARILRGITGTRNSAQSFAIVVACLSVTTFTMALSSGYSNEFVEHQWTVVDALKATLVCLFESTSRVLELYWLFSVPYLVPMLWKPMRKRFTFLEIFEADVEIDPFLIGIFSIISRRLYDTFYHHVYEGLPDFDLYYAQLCVLFCTTLLKLIWKHLSLVCQLHFVASDDDAAVDVLWELKLDAFVVLCSCGRLFYYLWNIYRGRAIPDIQNAWVASVLVDIYWYYGSVLWLFLHTLFWMLKKRDSLKLPESLSSLTPSASTPPAAASPERTSVPRQSHPPDSPALPMAPGPDTAAMPPATDYSSPPPAPQASLKARVFRFAYILSCFVFSQYFIYALIYLTSVFHLFTANDSESPFLSNLFSFYSLEEFKHFLRINVTDINLGVHVIGLREPLSNTDFANLTSREDPNIIGWFYPHGHYFNTHPTLVDFFNISSTYIPEY